MRNPDPTPGAGGARCPFIKKCFPPLLFVLCWLVPCAGGQGAMASPGGAGIRGDLFSVPVFSGTPGFAGPLEGYNGVPSMMLAEASAHGEGEEEERPRRRRRDMVEPVVPESIPDPLEPLNRVIFQFNDRVYIWVLKPVSKGYRKVVPWEIRKGTRNFFTNLFMPVRAINCLLQGNVSGFGTELLRFVVNTTAGVGGLADPASAIGLEAQKEDMGRTLATAGFGSGAYLVLPILGPSSVRDTLGMAGDAFLTPLNYYPDEFRYRIRLQAAGRLDDTFSRVDDYETMKEISFDPYSAVRDAYFQMRAMERK